MSTAKAGKPKMTQKVLVVDDEPDIVELLVYNLQKEGYEVDTAANGQEAVEATKRFVPDLILMDIMMPKMDGIEAAHQIKKIPEFKNVYLLFLTARSEEYSEIAAFEIGADDYISKPIKPRALMSRISAAFRRETSKTEAPDTLEVAGMSISRRNYSVMIGDKTIVLPKKEFELLFFLAQSPEKVFGREELLHKIWGADIYVLERTVDVHIRKLREKLGDGLIKTLKGVGYLLTEGE